MVLGVAGIGRMAVKTPPWEKERKLGAASGAEQDTV